MPFVSSFSKSSLIGGDGDDTYIYNIGDGEDTINDAAGEDDYILMGTGIAIEDIILAQIGNNLEITFDGVTGDKITIVDHYDTSITNTVEKIVFEDASELSLMPIIYNEINGTPSNETINGSADPDLIPWCERS